MTTFHIREVETIIAIVWEGFSVHVWALDEYDSFRNRFWYLHENALKFRGTGSRAEAIAIGKKHLEEMILDANRPFSPHSAEFLNSIKEPFVGPVSRTLLVTAEGWEIRIRMETDDYCSHRWTTRATAFDVRNVRSRRHAISRAKRYLVNQIRCYGPKTKAAPYGAYELTDVDMPF